MKKLFLFLVTILLPLVAIADAVEIDGIYYNVIVKGKVAEVVANPNKYKDIIVIPNSIIYKGVECVVTSIDTNAFSGCNNLTSVTIGDNVKTIGEKTFSECSRLTSVTIGNSVISIGDQAFYDCNHLVSIVIPSSVTDIGTYAFYSCYCLTSITIPKSVKNIKEYTFGFCSSLTSIVIPDSVTNIGDRAFFCCDKLSSVTIPSSLTSIGNDAFTGCSGLTSIYISDLDAWCKINFNYLSNPLYFAHHLYLNGEEIKDLVIPTSVTRIGLYTFEGCSGLTSVIIPNSVTYIGGAAFNGCNNLTTITIGSGVETIYQSFANCPELTDVYCYAKKVPDTVTSAFEGSFIEYANLHVLQSSMSDYENKEPWSKFNNITKIMMPEYTLYYYVDGEVYKTYKIEEGTSITPEVDPIKDGYTFSGWSDIPGTMPAHDVTVTGTFTKLLLGKCTTPTINIVDGKLHFDCDTPDVTYNYNIITLDDTSGKGNDIILTNTYKITVYATKDGYESSDVATKEIKFATGFDLNGDNKVNAADVVKLVNIIINQTD